MRREKREEKRGKREKREERRERLEAYSDTLIRVYKKHDLTPAIF